ncbi:MAG: heat-inducible transcription repressor HrcA [Myxococcales bacterium]|nr:heat-inducible transcription repressor HrcA [Myxococcales bacterium]
MPPESPPVLSKPLSQRQRQILYAAVTEYIASGQAVSSRALARRYELNLSAASIRNVLADLEELGCLTQPHTSAGRVPTDIGFRVFVDTLMQVQVLGIQDRSRVTARLRRLYEERQGDFMSESGKLLASLTGAAAVLTTPRAEDVALSQVRYLLLEGSQLLVMLIMRSGAVQSRVIKITVPLKNSDLDQIHRYLDEHVKGRTLEELRLRLAEEMVREQGEYRDLCAKTKDMIDATLDSSSPRPQLLIEGQVALLDRLEFSNADHLRGLMRALEEKERLLELLDRTLEAKGVQVIIGAETQLGTHGELSVISAHYGVIGGTVGVIAPKRVDYGKVVPLVDFTARVMTALLDPDGRDE